MEVSHEAASKEGSSRTRNPRRKEKPQSTNRSHCGEIGGPVVDQAAPGLRRSARLLSKQLHQQELLRKERELLSSDSLSAIEQQVSIKKYSSRSSRLQSTSSIASSSSTLIGGGNGLSVVSSNPEPASVSQNFRQFSLSRSPVRCNEKTRKISERGRKKDSTNTEIVNGKEGDLTDSDNCPGTHSLRKKSLKQRSPQQSEETEGKRTGKRTRSSNSDNYIPPSKRKRLSSASESKSTASPSKRKRSSKTQKVEFASSGSESAKKHKLKSKAVLAVVEGTANNNSSDSTSSTSAVKAVKRKRHLRTKSRRSNKESVVLSDSDSSPTHQTSAKRRARERGKGKVRQQRQRLDSESVTKEKEQPSTKRRTEELHPFTTNHFYSLPPFPEFARLAMASEGSKDQMVPPGEPKASTSNSTGDAAKSEGGAAPPPPEQGSSSSASNAEPSPFDPFSAAANEDTRRLQAMMEARGLPPHLLGSLGSKMHYILHKSFSSSMSSTNNSRAQQLLTGIEAMDDEGLQLQSCIEMGQLLVMGNEDTLSGFPVKQAVPALIKLLGMEHNFDMMLNACRSLTYMMEALPRSTAVVANAIPMLIEKLQVIQCMDVAEQALSALELLSRRHGKAILQAGGLGSCLLYLDFFSIAPQRNALSIAASCCQSVGEDDFPLVVDALPVLTGRLQQQDKRSVESCCLCFSRLVENFFSSPTILKQIASQGLLPSLQQLLVVSPPVISSSTFVTVMRMLSNLCAACPLLAVELLKLNMAETLRYLIVGSGEITVENMELTSRSPNEVYEILSLAGELMPPLPKGGVFEIEEIISSKRPTTTTIQWEWQDNDREWRAYGKTENRMIEIAHMTHEEECAIDLNSNSYIIDFSAMQQINEDTGTTRSIRRTVVNIASSLAAARKDHPVEEDARLVAVRDDPELGGAFVQALFGPLYEVFNSMAGPAIRNKCMKTILKILYHTDAKILFEILKDISVSSHLATMLKAQDYRVVVGAIQMAEILMEKLPDIFNIYFHREGVMYQLKVLKEHPLKTLATPKQEVITPPTVPVTAPPPSDTPTSTRKRLSDIFRKGKRHFRRNFRSRGEDQEPSPGPSQASPPVSRSSTGSSSEGKPPSAGISSTDGASVASAPRRADSAGTSETESSKGRIQHWIHEQVSGFLEKWEGSANQNPALNIVKKLVDAAKDLDPGSLSCLSAIGVVCSILVDSNSSVSAFEFMHCKLHSKLLSYLTLDSPDCAVPLNARLRRFLHIFVGLPEQDALLAEWSPSPQLGLVALLQKLHGCINQLEQFPVKVHDLPGRRGSQALKFLNTHHIKCSLEKHPQAVNTCQWKGGPLRIDPLATIQTLERYMMIRGFGRHEHGSRRIDDLDSEDNEVDEAMIQHFSGQGTDKHFVEFLINDRVLPYNMTMFQAIRQFAMAGLHQDGEEESMSFGRPEIWIRTHAIQYRSVNADASGAGPSSGASASLASTLFPSSSSSSTSSSSSSSRKHLWGSSSGGVRKRSTSAKIPTPPTSGVLPRVTRSTSARAASTPRNISTSAAPLPRVPKRSSSGGGNSGAEATPRSLSPSETVKEKEQVKLSPLHQSLLSCVKSRPVTEDPSMPIIRLIHALYILNTHWTDLYPGLAGNPIASLTEFINNKLTAKATRQLQDPLNVMTGNFPAWLQNLAMTCPFLFPFDCRQSLFYLTTFDRDRAVARLQEQQPELSNADASQTVGPRFDRKKRCVSRDNLLEQAEKLMNELASNKAILEIHYEDEVGTGLGPTLEFYALVSRELQRSDLLLFRGDPCPIPGASRDGGSGDAEYVHSPVGLFPVPLGPSTRFSIVEDICSKFKFMGKLMAKAIMDSRMLDLPLSEAFYKWMLGTEDTFTAQDLQHVDPVVANSFSQLAAVAVKKHTLESDPLLTGKALAVGIESLTLDGGGTIEDLDIDFTLPGYPDLELKPGGKNLQVTIYNLDEYLKLVVEWTLVRGVARQMEAFKEGFNSVFPLSNMQGLFYPSEMDLMICGAHHQKWDIKELMECCRPDHGYSHDSRAVQFLFEVLSTYDTTEQRQFVQFVTGTPRLPVGGFKSLNPPLTIVRKTVEQPHNPDNFLPSVMTCVNYLKLPDYTSVEVMRERLHLALMEGKLSFHLS